MIIKILYKKLILFSNKRKFIKNKVLFHEFSKIDSNCYFEGYNAVGVNTKLKNTYLGVGSYVGRNCELQSVKIGKFCSIGSFIVNTMGRHPTSKFVSTHPAFFSKGKAAGFTFVNKNKYKELFYTDASQKYFVEIGNDVWIGDRVTILDGINIGDGAVIGANSLVTRDIPPYTVNVGVPAKTIKTRFSEKQLMFLKNNNLWDKGIEWIKENAEYFSDIEVLMKNMKKHEK